jgi:CubicO group peptidase (beta-lactamase class C family)
MNPRCILESIRNYVPDGFPGGAVLVSENGKVVVSGGFGMADVEGHIPNTDQTRFLIGSISKQFTATAILQLVERGALNLDETVVRFFPSFPAYGAHITVRHLLTHTSGIREYLMDDFWNDPQHLQREMTQNEVVNMILSYPSGDFVPGSRHVYCNSGYVLLGAMIEELSSMSYQDYINTHILRPLGMKQTIIGTSSTIEIPARAKGYIRDQGGNPVRAPYTMATIGWGDGNLISTVGDLFIWHQGWQHTPLLGSEMMHEMFNPYVLTDGTCTSYGFGWFINNRRGVAETWHSGGTQGYISRYSRFPDVDKAVIILTNDQGIRRDELFGAVVEQVLAKEMDPIVIQDAVPALYQQLPGEYVAPNMLVRIRRCQGDAGPLEINLDESAPTWITLTPVGRTRFRLDNPADFYLEVLNESHIQLNLNGRLLTMEKQ